MTAQAFVGGAWVTLRRGQVRVGGAWRNLTRVKVYKGGQWRDGPIFVTPLSASASPSDVSGSASSLGGTTVTSGYATATPSGGLAPFTYSWSVGGGLTITNPASATTAFSKFLSPTQEILTDGTCTVTDALGSTAQAIVGVDLINEG